MRAYEFRDSLYGDIGLDDEMSALASEPVIQRLRHVRLSNIDSIDIPGIANLSRYEHVLGVTHLASKVAFRRRLSRFDDLVLKGSALLHDWAITSFGHLVEEALQYVGTGFDHQERLKEIASGNAPDEILGVGRQILVGRETGLARWVNGVSQSDAEGHSLLTAITEHIRGKGKFGRIICGDIDLDNIDNVFRMAYHMGLNVDRAVPIRLASAIVDHGIMGRPVFRLAAENDIEIWRRTRSAVYEHLMLAERDFVGKTMLLYATICAYEAGEIRSVDWSLTDFGFIQKLLASDVRDTKETAERWIAGEPWDFAPLHWMDGERPDYVRLRAFSKELSETSERNCFAYGIKDKRDRQLSILFDDGSTQMLGLNSGQWLLGIGSPERRGFTGSEVKKAFALARSYFHSELVGPASSRQLRQHETQPSFL